MRLGETALWDRLKRAGRRAWFTLCGHGVLIKSSRASVHAAYGKKARVCPNVLVTRDVSIGDYSYVNRDSTVEKCDIGSYCSISSGVRINPWNHDLDSLSTSPWLGGSTYDLRERVVIENDVLVSVNAVILSGVRLGTGCVIAAGAVVTKDVPPFEVWGGVPARRLSVRLDEAQRAALLGCECWHMTPREAREELGRLAEHHGR